MSNILLEIALILGLILLNGLLAMAEIAIVSARKIRLEQRARDGDDRARAALTLANAPTEFLASVQIGITLVGVLAGAFGGATLTVQLADWLAQVPALAQYAEAVALACVVTLITLLTLVFGELVPKSLGLRDPEAVASSVAVPMRALSRVASPLVHFLSFLSDSVVRLFGAAPSQEPPVTEEELKVMVEQGTLAGVFAQVESTMIERVLRLGDRRVGNLMTPRTEIHWLDLEDPLPDLQMKIIQCSHSTLPVARGNLDRIEGVVSAHDLLVHSLEGHPLDIKAVMKPPLFMPEGLPAFKALEIFQTSRQHLVLILDEFGGVQGLVTINDILQAIAGDMPMLNELYEPQIVLRPDGSWLVDGRMLLDEFQDRLDIKELPLTEQYYDTVGGFVMDRLARIPTAGDIFVWEDLKFEVVDMDGFRVDKVLISRIRST